MDSKERIKRLKEKYSNAQESGELNRRNARSSNPLDAFNHELAEKTLKEQFKDGKTIVPIDLAEFWKESGNTMDFTHAKDKAVRYFEILTLNHLYPEEMKNIHGVYGTETTEILRKHFTRGKHFIVESNSEKELAFLHINVSDLTTNESAD